MSNIATYLRDRSPERRELVARLICHMRNAGSWTGETHLQKIAFYLQTLLKCDLGVRFYLYRYGPYNSNIRDTLAYMRWANEIQAEDHDPYAPKLDLTDAGRALIEQPGAWDRQIEWLAAKLGKKSAGQLEGPSTAFLLRWQRNQKGITQWEDRDLAHEIYRLKNHISVERAYVAIREAKELEAAAERDGVILGPT